MSINLKDGTINAHEFTLSAGSGNKSIVISTSASTYPLSIGSYFDVEWDGTLHATNGNFSGDISGSSITGSEIHGGSIEIGSHFKVDSRGYMTATGATFEGNISASSIQGSTISNGSLFNVDAAGNVSCGYITATGGTIAGCNINGSNSLSANFSNTKGW